MDGARSVKKVNSMKQVRRQNSDTVVSLVVNDDGEEQTHFGDNESLAIKTADSHNELEPEGKTTDDSKERTARTIYVGNLPASTTNKAIRKLFSGFGNIEKIRFIDTVSRVPKRDKKLAGCIVFKEKSSVQEALVMNGTQVEDSAIKVKSWTNEEKFEKDFSIVVNNLTLGVQEEQIRELFADCGTISAFRLLPGRTTETKIAKDFNANGYAFVCFENADGVARAFKKDGEKLVDKNIRVLPKTRHWKKAKRSIKTRNDAPAPNYKNTKSKKKNKGKKTKNPAENFNKGKSASNSDQIRQGKSKQQLDSGKPKVASAPASKTFTIDKKGKRSPKKVEGSKGKSRGDPGGAKKRYFKT